MTMHLIKGVRVIGSKKKAKRKPGWREAEAEYEAFLRKHGIDPNQKPKKREFIPYEKPKSTVFVRETPYYPSFSSAPAKTELLGNDTPKQEPMQYSGDYIVGIATMHKSNMVPVGREDNPEDYSTMRRN